MSRVSVGFSKLILWALLITVSVIGATSVAYAAPPVVQFFQGFEADSVWGDPPTDPTRVASGTNGITSKTGAWHAEALSGDFTRWGGYSSVFPTNGFSTSIDIYFNVGGGFANDTRFAWTSAVSNTVGAHRRDFVFSGGFYSDGGPYGAGNRFVFSASNNAPGNPRDPGRGPVAITASGWYTLKHTFLAGSGGVLVVKMELIDSSNNTLGAWSLSDPTDIIGTTVGGNRYGWFFSSGFPFLAIDNSQRLDLGDPNILNVQYSHPSLDPNAWFIYNDENDTIDNTLGSLVVGPDSPPLGTGSAQISVTGTERRNLATYQFSGTPLASIGTLRYSTYNPSAGNGGSANRSGYLQFNADFNGSDTWQRRLLFLPTDNGAVIQNTWQEWDTLNNGNALWRYSGLTWPAGIGEPGTTPGTTPKTWNVILSTYPGVRVRVTDSFLGIRVGEPYADGYTENLDAVKFGTPSSLTFFNFDPLDFDRFVDDDGMAGVNGCDTADVASTTINGAIVAASAGESIYVCPGNYLEDVVVNKANLTLQGAGMDSTIITGPHTTGGGDTVLVQSSGVTVDGFTITRTGNTAADWAANTQNQGINVAASTNFTLRNSTVTGNRNGIYVGQSSHNVTLYRNVIDFNRTGVHLVDNNGGLIEENAITNNWTMGLLYRCEGCAIDPSPLVVRNNNISGNWYSEIEFREPALGGSLNMSGNYLGTTTPTRVITQSGEPGYTSQIPVAYGGTASPPPSHPTIAGPQSARVDYSPFLRTGADTQPATNGFQGDPSNASITADGAHVAPPATRLEEGLAFVPDGGTLYLAGGTYTGDIDTSGKALTIAPGASPGQVILVGNLTLDSNDTLAIEIEGPNLPSDYDNFVVTGTVTLGGAALTLSGSYVPVGSDSFTIIDNDAADAVGGIFASQAENSVVTLNSVALNVSYVDGPGGTGNNVVLGTTSGPCITVTTAPHIDTLTNVNVSIPVTIGDTTGRQMTGAQFVFNYDPSILSSNPVNIDVVNGSVATAPLIVVNDITPGQVAVSISTTDPFVGAGVLVNINMRVVGPIGSTTPTDLSQVLLFKVGPQQIVCSTVTDSTLTVISAGITGNVTYNLERFAQPTVSQPVPLVTVSALGPTPPAPSITDAAGDYTMDGFSFGSYNLSPAKPDKVCGLGPFNGIGSNDATLIARYVVLLDNMSTDQQEAAQVANLGFVNSLDASLVARFAVCIATPGSLVGQWRFKPLFSPAPGPINTISGGDYDFFALLMGDVTGDWSPTGPLRPAPPEDPKLAVRASVPTANAETGSTAIVPLRMENLRGQGVGSYQFDITYDPKVVEPADIAAELTGTVGESLNVVSNSPEPGLLKVAVYGILPVTGDGIYANLRFTVIGEVGSTTPIKIAWIEFNDGEKYVAVENGSLAVAESSGSVIKGRLVSTMGQNIRNTRVILTSDTGERTYAITSSFGLFEFGALLPGGSYTVTVDSKRYRFAPQIVSAANGLTSLEMTALD